MFREFKSLKWFVFLVGADLIIGITLHLLGFWKWYFNVWGM